MVVEAWLARAAAARPRQPALLTAEGACSYAELYASARAGSHALAARGAAPGARVAIALPPGLAFAGALHACLLLGAVAVPVDVRLTEAEREQILNGCAVRVEQPLADGGRPGDREPGVGGDAGTGAGPPAGAGHDLDAVAVVVHTSGSIGAPVPVELTYANILWSALGSAVALGVHSEERWLCALPVAHVGGLSILLRSAIYATTAVVHERFEAERVMGALSEQRVSIVSLVATTLARLLDAGLRGTPALRCVLLGGGPVPAGLLARAREAGVPVALTYGLTEAASQVTTTPAAVLASAEGYHAAGEQTGGRLQAGPPLFCTRVAIAPDGEILVRGPTVAPGSLAGEGWLHTGDLGSLDGQGRLSVEGRKAETIISGGENVAPAEVEGVLESHPLVLEAGVFAGRDERWGEVVSAVVVAREGEQLQTEELRAHCARQLAPYKIPKRIVLAAGPLPRTRSGKLLRRELR
jgi:O-succinylbenzoic acid--CoA ligase